MLPRLAQHLSLSLIQHTLPGPVLDSGMRPGTGRPVHLYSGEGWTGRRVHSLAATRFLTAEPASRSILWGADGKTFSGAAVWELRAARGRCRGSGLSCHSEQVLGVRGATGCFPYRPTGVYFLLSLPHCAYSRFFFYHFIPKCIRLCPSKKESNFRIMA